MDSGEKGSRDLDSSEVTHTPPARETLVWPAVPRLLDSKPGPEAEAFRYQIEGELGRGGQSVVYRAVDRQMGREVALKQLLPQWRGEPGDRSPAEDRFLREARITGALEHPGINPVHDLGARPDGSIYYTQKIVRGQTLRELLPVFLAVCDAVAYAHSRGVIHRDLKPENIMIGAFGETMVLDWGLARV